MRMMLLHQPSFHYNFYYNSNNHRSNHHQYQAIQGQLDLTFQMMWQYRMHHHPVWLTEVDDNLFIIQFFTPTNQGEWWCASNPFPLFLIIVSTETRWTNINGPNRRDVWYFKCCSHSECSFSQFNWVQLRKIYSLFHSTIVASQCERLCSAHVSFAIATIVVVYFRMATVTPLTKLNWQKRS